ncbi:aspartyl-phosphate phosphatase Spo0E family protein [Niallia sp. FSL W8-0635]|uniref:aspartyl-phosphate phosphatase Spo0E family protein n=1 Tax=Niallia sp. FSL W8-0635 TaxID=2975337 RepID=UPI0009CF9013|nr:Spo0E like sporulation regulatory protein [Mycobacteroides abscessus subsp. abscessus]HEO8419367.1 aspartyl-phosphate phosphatase Spo0E family protein [Yersinia enterocolitica]
MALSRANIDNVCELLDTIDLLKTELLKYGIEKGLNDPNTIQISELLDTYIIMYQKKIAQK